MTTEKDADGKMKVTVSIDFGAGVTVRKVAYTDGPGELSIPLNEFELVTEDDADKEGEAGKCGSCRASTRARGRRTANG